MVGENGKRYVYRNKITGAEFLSSSICSGGAWELVKTIRAAKQPVEKKPRRKDEGLLYERYDVSDDE